jgi:hypothetical protein
MVSNFDFSAGIANSPALDRIQRGDRIRDDLPRRRDQFREKPDKEDSSDASPEDIMTSDDDGTEKRRLDLRA